MNALLQTVFKFITTRQFFNFILTVDVKYSDCAERFMCNNQICQNLLGSAANIEPYAVIEACNVSCCERNLCNEVTDNTTTTGQILTTVGTSVENTVRGTTEGNNSK